MPQQTLYVNISDFGSIAGVNPFKSRDEVLIKYWCKTNPTRAFEVLKKNGYITETDEAVSIAESVNAVQKEFENDLDRKRPSNQNDANKIKEKYAKKISEACKKDQLDEDVASKLQKNIFSKVNKQCGENTEKTTLDSTEKKSGIVIRKRNSQMYYKTIYEDKNYKFLIGGKVDGISNSDLIIEAKYRTKETNVRKNKYDLFQLLGYLFVTGKTKGKIVQKHGNHIWDSDEETENEWGIIQITDNETWINFLNVDLFSFFEQMKYYPSNFSVIEKPFLTISRGKFYPISGISDTENFLIESFLGTIYFHPLSCKPAAISPSKPKVEGSIGNYTKLSNKNTVSLNSDHKLAKNDRKLDESESVLIINTKSEPEVPVKDDEQSKCDTPVKEDKRSNNDTSLCEKFHCNIPNNFDDSSSKSMKCVVSEAASTSSAVIFDTNVLGGTPVKNQEVESEIFSPILIESREKMTSSPKQCKNDKLSDEESIETVSFSEPSLESNLSEYIEAANIAEISTEFNEHVENRDFDSIENEIYSQKEDSIETVSSGGASGESNISEFLEAGNVAEISSDFITTLDEESDIDFGSD